MDLWRWAPVPSDLPISAGSSTSVNDLGDRQQLAVTYRLLRKMVAGSVLSICGIPCLAI